MYAKCGALDKAQEVFDELPVRNAISWNSLLTAYTQDGQGEEALRFYEQMKLGGFSPDAYTFACILKACGIVGALNVGQDVHVQIAREHSLRKDLVIGNALVDMYAKCGALHKAQEVFDRILTRDVVTWNGLIGGYAENGYGERALSCFEEMQAWGLAPNAVTFTAALKACSSIGALVEGEDIHDQLLRACMLRKNIMVTNALIVMYAKCNALDRAREVFDAMPARNVVSWTALITGYSEYGSIQEALSCFEQMQVAGFSPDMVTFCCVLKACGTIGALEKGQEIHGQIVREHVLEKHTLVANALIDMYAKCGALQNAQEVFNSLRFLDLVSWNTLFAGFAQQKCGEDVLLLFKRMLLQAFSPNEFSLSCILKVCGNTGALNKGLMIHAQITGECLEDKCIVIGTALVDMYAKCGDLNEALKVFMELPVRDVVSWNALISGYAYNEHNIEVLGSLEIMECEGISPDAITLVCILRACSSTAAINKGQKLHVKIVKHGLLEEYVALGNALIDMYANCCMLSEAQDVFNKLRNRDVVSWNVLIACYIDHEYIQKALSCYHSMHVQGFSPDAITLSCVAKACSVIGFLCKGQCTHAEAVKYGFLGTGVSIDSGLLVMYASCGMLEEAQFMFDNLLIHDVVSWTALMAGYAQYGLDETVFLLFNNMISKGREPDFVVWTILLYTCSHGGLLDEGLQWFECINKELIATADHLACIVDLFCRTGRLDKAVALIENAPFLIDVTIWRTLLGACYKWMDKQFGRWAFDHAVQLNKEDGSAYVCLSNIYAGAGRYNGHECHRNVT